VTAIIAGALLVFPVPPVRADLGDAVTRVIDRGRTVDVSFVEDLHPADLTAGAEIQLEVARSVLVGGAVAIREGAPAVGYAEVVKRRGPVGSPAALRIVVKRTLAVDGTIVPLSGVYSTIGEERHAEVFSFAWAVCICGLLAPGEEVAISRGTLVGCFVTEEVRIGADCCE